MEILAKYEAPKQRMTVHYGIRLVKRLPFYEVETYTIATGGTLQTLTSSRSIVNAWAQFHSAIVEKSQYGPSTWEVEHE